MSIARVLALSLLWVFTVGTGLCALMSMASFASKGGDVVLGVAGVAALCCCLGYVAIRALRRKAPQAKPEEHP